MATAIRLFVAFTSGYGTGTLLVALLKAILHVH
jgi:hypothetical protein